MENLPDTSAHDQQLESQLLLFATIMDDQQHHPPVKHIIVASVTIIQDGDIEVVVSFFLIFI